MIVVVVIIIKKYWGVTKTKEIISHSITALNSKPHTRNYIFEAFIISWHGYTSTRVNPRYIIYRAGQCTGLLY